MRNIIPGALSKVNHSDGGGQSFTVETSPHKRGQRLELFLAIMRTQFKPRRQLTRAFQVNFLLELEEMSKTTFMALKEVTVIATAAYLLASIFKIHECQTSTAFSPTVPAKIDFQGSLWHLVVQHSLENNKTAATPLWHSIDKKKSLDKEDFSLAYIGENTWTSDTCLWCAEG